MFHTSRAIKISRAIFAGLLLAILAGSLSADDPPAESDLQIVLTTVDDEQVSGKIGALADGKFVLASDPPRAFALVDLQRIEFGKLLSSGGADLVWIGQDNHDLVQVGGATGGNGIQDLHLQMHNLPALALKQIVAVCRFPGQLRVWRLDTSQSPHWRLAVSRADLAKEADLYLEPASVDAFGMSFDFTFTFADGSTVKASTKATTHSSDQTKVDRGAPSGQAEPAAKGEKAADKPAAGPTPAKAEVYLEDQGRLQGELVEMNSESLSLRAAWKGDVQIPLLRAKGVWFANSAPATVRADFDKQMAAPVADDVVFLLSPDKTTAQVQGSVRGFGDGKLSLRFEGADRTVKQDRLLGIVFAAHPKTPPVTAPYQTLLLKSGDSISGSWIGMKEMVLDVETFWQTHILVPPALVSEIRMRNGRLTFLSDLEPVTVEEVAYFGRKIPWRRDQGFDGGPAKIKGKQPARSLAMHSRSVLTYALDGQFEKFKATLGFDDSAEKRGRALCRVTVDGREAFVQPDLRSDADPVAVEIPLAGARQLALEVDFGADDDIGDRVIWAEPRLFRTESK